MSNRQGFTIEETLDLLRNKTILLTKSNNAKQIDALIRLQRTAVDAIRLELWLDPESKMEIQQYIKPNTNRKQIARIRALLNDEKNMLIEKNFSV